MTLINFWQHDVTCAKNSKFLQLSTGQVKKGRFHIFIEYVTVYNFLFFSLIYFKLFYLRRKVCTYNFNIIFSIDRFSFRMSRWERKFFQCTLTNIFFEIACMNYSQRAKEKLITLGAEIKMSYGSLSYFLRCSELFPATTTCCTPEFCPRCYRAFSLRYSHSNSFDIRVILMFQIEHRYKQ